MDNFYHIHLSNRTERLYQELKERLFASTHPLTKRIVIVPSPAMKSWLKLQMAEDPEIGVSAGIEIGFVETTINSLYRSVCKRPQTNEPDPYEPSPLELALALEDSILSVANSYLSSLHQIRPEWMLLLQYLGLSKINNKISRRILKRIRALASVLSNIFLEYGVSGAAMVAQWQSNPSCWQGLLWKKMESVFASWNYPAKKLSGFHVEREIDPQDIQIHVFGLSFLAPVYHRFLEKIAAHVSVYFYFLSPCQKFWGDALSDQESGRLKKYWSQKEVNAGSLHALEEFLRDRNPLLANFGRLGREMTIQMESAEAHSFGLYALPESVLEVPAYSELDSQEILFEKTQRPLSLLDAIQADLAFLRSPEMAEKISFSSYDATIQVHAVPKKEREVQVIYDTLLSIIEKHRHDDNPILPRDIFVMAPNISEYTPFIRSVFETGDSQLDIQLMDLQAPSQYKIIEGFLHLLSLSRGRWEASSLLRLFDYAAFRKRHHLSAEDLLAIRSWIKAAGIYWGKDDVHRDEIMERNYQRAYGQMKVGTWEYGLGRLLEGLAMLLPEEAEEEAYSPLDRIEASQGDLLGILLHLIRSLQSDLKPLINGSRLTLEDWSAYLKCLLEAYFAPGDEDEDVAGYRLLLGHLESFAKASKRLQDVKFSYDTIHTHLQKGLEKETSTYKDSNLQAVRFSSLLPMRAVPARVVVLMGMSEGQFPGNDQANQLNLLLENPLADYFPNRVDFDRYVFLESILSARDYFIISYESQVAGEIKSQSPSLVVKELMSYLDQSYSIEQSGHFENPTKFCHFSHPLIPFHQNYFSESGRFKSHSKKYYAAAKAYYQVDKQARRAFLPNFIPAPDESGPAQEQIIDLKDLLAFSKNPLKVYLNQVLGIYLERESDRIVKDDDDLFLSSLNAAILTKQGLTGSKSAVLQQAEKAGKIPQGPFKGLAIDKIKQQIDQYHKNLKSFGLSVDELLSIELTDHCHEPVLEGKVWTFPPFEVDCPVFGKVKVVGRIDHVSSKGWVLLQEDDNKKVLELWPAYLVLSCIIEKYAFPVDPQMLFIKGEKVKNRKIDNSRKTPQEALIDYVEYYLRNSKQPSPLAPDWVSPILTGDSDKIKGIFKKDPNEEFFPQYDPYIKWFKRNSIHAELEATGNHWQPAAQNLFVDIFAKSKSKYTGSIHEGADDSL